MSKLTRFAEVFQVPPAMLPYIDHVATEQEMDLVIGLAERSESTVAEIAEMMGMPLEEAQDFVTRAFHRAVIARVGLGYSHDESSVEGTQKYKVGTFYHRLDPLSMYESWGDVPVEAREAVIAWQLQEFINIWRPAIEQIQNDPDVQVSIPNRGFLLLEEALEMVEAATDYVVVPCDCRAIVRACDRPSEVCVRLDQAAAMTLEHGHGRRVTLDEMKRIVVDANRAGLMHTGDRNWKENGRAFGFCNCCACDCYPIRAGIQLGIPDAWPRVYYVAERDMSKCVQCGLCATRCHFGAFYRSEARVEVDGKSRKEVQFNAGECRGCGICATACPEQAITMRLLRPVEEVAV